jgi:hypothetical protein
MEFFMVLSMVKLRAKKYFVKIGIAGIVCQLGGLLWVHTLQGLFNTLLIQLVVAGPSFPFLSAPIYDFNQTGTLTPGKQMLS